MNFHLVIYAEGVTLVKKEKLTLDDAYLDTRALGPLQFAALPKPVKVYLLKKGWQETKTKIGTTLDTIKETLVGD